MFGRWMGGVQPFGSLNLLILIRYILQTYSYIFVAKAVILTGKRSLKRQNMKEITKEKEKTRESEKRSYKRKGKDKNRKRKYGWKSNKLLLTKVSQGSRRAALFFYLFFVHF